MEVDLLVSLKLGADAMIGLRPGASLRARAQLYRHRRRVPERGEPGGLYGALKKAEYGAEASLRTARRARFWAAFSVVFYSRWRFKEVCRLLLATTAYQPPRR